MFLLPVPTCGESSSAEIATTANRYEAAASTELRSLLDPTKSPHSQGQKG